MVSQCRDNELKASIRKAKTMTLGWPTAKANPPTCSSLCLLRKSLGAKVSSRSAYILEQSTRILPEETGPRCTNLSVWATSVSFARGTLADITEVKWFTVLGYFRSGQREITWKTMSQGVATHVFAAFHPSITTHRKLILWVAHRSKLTKSGREQWKLCPGLYSTEAGGGPQLGAGSDRSRTTVEVD